MLAFFFIIIHLSTITHYFSQLQDCFNNSSMKRCHICQVDTKRLTYSCCCKQSKFYCYKCDTKTCLECYRRLQLQKKQKIQTPNRFQMTCSSCKQFRSLTDYQFYEQKKCRQNFCYACLIQLYDKYFQSLEQIEKQQRIRPQFPFQLPCGCQISQKQIVIFLQKSCYCCNMKIDTYQAYRLSKNLRVNKSCMRKLQTTRSIAYIYKLNKQKLQKIEKMILKCQGCDVPLDSKIQNQQNLNVCKKCIDLNKQEVNILERQKQAKKSVKKQVQYIDIQVKIQRKYAQVKKNGKNNLNKNELEILKQQEINLQKKIQQPNQQILLKQKLKYDSEKEILKPIEEQKSFILSNNVEPKIMKLSGSIFQNLKECKKCLMILQIGDLISKTIESISSNSSKIETDQRNGKLNGQQKQNICKLCYFQIKAKQKIIERQSKLVQKFDRMRLYNSSYKPQKKVEANKIILANFDNYYQPSVHLKKIQLQKNIEVKNSPYTISHIASTSNNYLIQKCLKCSKRINISQLKDKICRNCVSQALEKQNKVKKEEKMVDIVCRKCQKQKKIKQSEVGKYGHCSQCLFNLMGCK